MHILHICNDYYYSSVYKCLHQNLLLKNIESWMLVPSKKNELVRPRETNVIQVQCFNNIDKYFFYFKQKKIFHHIKKYVEELNPELIHAHFVFSSGYACMKLKKEYNIPYIVAVRNTDVNLYLKHMVHLRKVGIQVMLNAEKVIFISPVYRDIVINNYVPLKYRKTIIEKSVVLPNGIDYFWHENCYLNKNESIGQNIHLLTVGAINENKNQLTVLRAIEILRNEGYKIKYNVVGRIENEKVYSELIKNSCVNYIKSQSKEELIDYYRQADIFVMPSKTETFGLVYAEAMSQGLPVIYTRGEGFDGQFDVGEVGYSVDYSDPKDIVKAIKNIVNNYKNVSKNSLKNSSKFNWGKITNEYITLYDEIRGHNKN